MVREAKRDEEWEQRARQIEQEEQTLHHLKVEEAKKKKEKRMFEDKVNFNKILTKVGAIAHPHHH